jgi:hypothetical protein
MVRKPARSEPVAPTASAKAVEERRQAILDVAEALFAENGIAGTSVRSILAAAGDTRPARVAGAASAVPRRPVRLQTDAGVAERRARIVGSSLAPGKYETRSCSPRGE